MSIKILNESIMPITKELSGLEVENEAGFPKLSIDKFRDAWRLDSTSSDARLIAQVNVASLVVNTQLLILKGKEWDERALALYEAAVFNRAKARLVESYIDADTKLSPKARELGESADEYLRASSEAISLLLDKPAIRAEVI